MANQKKRINEQIRASKVYLISETGEKLGEVGLSEAIERAKRVEMDIVEVSERDGKVIAKIMDWGKEVFKKRKNISKSKAASKKASLKTIRITYKIGEHDLEIRKKQAEKFAKSGHPIKIALILRGRERKFEDIAKEKVLTFAQSLEEIYKIDGTISIAGNSLSLMMTLKK